MGSTSDIHRGGRNAPGKRSPAAATSDVLIAAWPGPAARLCADGSVRVANAAAAPLLEELRARAGVAGLKALLAGALADGEPRTDTIVVPAEPTALTFDLCLVPINDGGQAEAVILARDVSLAANLRHALAESRQRFKDLVEISSDFAWETDAGGAFTFVSPQGALGWSATDLLGRTAASFIADASSDSDALTPFVTRGRVDGAELWLRRADGMPACVSVSAVPLTGADGRWRGARGVWRDITETHAREAALAEAENRERLVGYITRMVRDETEPDAMLTAAASAVARALGAVGCRVWDCDSEGLTLAAEFGSTALAALDVDAPMSAHVRRLQLGTDAPRPDRDDQLALTVPGGKFLGAVTRFRHKINGAIGLWRWPDAPDWSDADHAVVSKVADQIGIAQEQIASQAALARQARTDALTGLLNRRGFAERLDARVARSARSGRASALVYVDLDNFKQVNDRLGHAAGDAALKALADALRRIVRVDDLVARLGGDEFAVWLEGADRATAVARAQEILALKEDIASYSAGADVPLGLSVGVAVHIPAEEETTSELLSRADEAMYAVKRRGKGSYAVAPDVAAFRAALQKPGTQESA